MRSNIVEFKASSPFSDSFELLHNDSTRKWYKEILMLSDLSGLPIQTVMENLDDITRHLQDYSRD